MLLYGRKLLRWAFRWQSYLLDLHPALDTNVIDLLCTSFRLLKLSMQVITYSW